MNEKSELRMASSRKDLLSVEYRDDAGASPFDLTASRRTKPDICKPEKSSALANAMAFLEQAELNPTKPVSIEEGFDGNEEGCLALDVGLVPIEESEKLAK
jgi:hypothetical protein